eukprot:TRINITY_DN905_c0_g1_i2.p1 TRINITY_DN905_c0_g1~~TRINITY_DN905_c0_g1_i2.p1  ORF type:complete len:296 (-),score=77.50 TRINITY_DN905_c0_g1_i2:158-1045(-)
MEAKIETHKDGYVVTVDNLDFDYGPGCEKVLHNINLKLKKGSRTLLVGANGTGKSTLLRILAGKHYLRNDEVYVLGKPVFSQTPEGIAYLGPEWAHDPIVRRDIPVTQLIKSNGGDQFPERRDRLLQILDIDTDWHMHRVSDGERRRVQIMLSLIRPFSLLLLDEVTVDLDILVRQDILNHLRSESEVNGITIIYATHIFDGLGDWATHIAHISNGKLAFAKEVSELEGDLDQVQSTNKSRNSPLLLLVEKWLRDELVVKRKLREERKSKKKELTLVQKLADDRKYGDKFYNYWN